MAKVSIPYNGSIVMSSTWKCDNIEHRVVNAKQGLYSDLWAIVSGPTTSTAKASFKYSFTSGTKIKSVTLWAKISGTTISLLTANGKKFSKTKSGKKGAVLSKNLISTGSSNATSERNEIRKNINNLGLNGNVDLTNRPEVPASKMKAAGYRDFDGSYATLYSETYTVSLGGTTYTVLMTPIMTNGTVLKQSELDSYVQTLDARCSTINAFKTSDSKKLLIHYLKGNKITEMDAIAVSAHNLSAEWEATKKVGNPGTLAVTLKFKGSGKIFEDNKTHIGKITLSGIVLEIEYEGSVGGTSTTTAKTTGLAVPPQSVCIYDATDGSIYLFDGVTKVQHALTMDVQEEKNSSKDKDYVNNAKNQPDKLTLDVVMSDVYTGGGSILNTNGNTSAAVQNAIEKTGKKLIQGRTGRTRSELAFYTLHWLKEKRRKLAVITPQYVYTEMILTTVTVNHEDTTPFGWEGQLVFQHAYEKKDGKKGKATSKAADGDGIPAPAGIVSWLGNLFK